MTIVFLPDDNDLKVPFFASSLVLQLPETLSKNTPTLWRDSSGFFLNNPYQEKRFYNRREISSISRNTAQEKGSSHCEGAGIGPAIHIPQQP